MSPRVEALRTLEIIKTDYFAIDLLAPDGFDLDLFDRQMECVGGSAKFIVVGNIMFVFPLWQSHSNFYNFLKHETTEELQCGGFVSVTSSIKGNLVARTIDGHSNSLSQFYSLPKARSNTYRDGVIKERLGEFFNVVGEK